MEEPVFKLPRVGLVGGRPVDATYMDAIERRAKQLDDASRGQRSQERATSSKLQMKLQFRDTHACQSRHRG